VGRAIRDRRSPYTIDDLTSRRQIVGASLNLTVDTTLPFELATSPCSSEGVPAGRVTLVSGGRLVSPILDPATAVDFGLPPTPSPRGHPSVLLTSDVSPLELSEALDVLDAGVVVRSLPGLHTQQPRRSAYALVAPDAQVVARGKASGRCAVRLAGNLLTQLRQPSPRLVRIPGVAGVGLLVLGDVELLPA
jgi:predicted Zn-dependent protease